MKMERAVRVAAFAAAQDAEGDAAWRPLPEPPCLVSCGPHDFVLEPGGQEERAYVDGCLVAGLALVEPGNFVLVRCRAGLVCYRYEGREAATEPGRGRLCALSRTPIDGPAVRCPAPTCGALLAQAVAEEVEICPDCRSPLPVGACPCPREESLL